MDKWEIGSQLEGLTCDLEILQDLLSLLYNEMDEGRELMDMLDSPNLARRQRPLQSLLIAATREADNIYTACKDLSDLLYKEAVQSGKQTGSKRKVNHHRRAQYPPQMRKDMTMSKAFEFGSTHDIELEGASLEVERTAAFFQIARQLSDFLAGLPLDQPANDRLVELMVEQVQQAEKGAFLQGFRMGIEFAGWEQGKSKPQKKPSVLN